MPPPDQGLQSADLSPVERDDGLVVHGQFFTTKRFGEGGLHAEGCDELRGAAAVGVLQSARTFTLRDVHGEICITKKPFRAVTGLGQDRSDTGADGEGALGRNEGGFQHLPDSPADAVEIVSTGMQVLAHDDELVSAEPAERVGGPEDLPQAGGYLDQHLVAHGVAVCVVYLFEAIEIEEQHPGRSWAAVQMGERQQESLLEEDAIGEPGQGIVQGLQPQSLLRLQTQLAVRRRGQTRGRGVGQDLNCADDLEGEGRLAGRVGVKGAPGVPLGDERDCDHPPYAQSERFHVVPWPPGRLPGQLRLHQPPGLHRLEARALAHSPLQVFQVLGPRAGRPGDVELFPLLPPFGRHDRDTGPEDRE
jgi:hypothetical protein